MTRVKICGITRWKDARIAVDHGADALGFVFYDKSPRFLSAGKARQIIRKLPPFVASVGVFVDAPLEEIQSIVQTCGLTAVQLHGGESPAFCNHFSTKVIKAFRVRGNRLPAKISRYDVHALLLDTFRAGIPGGTGHVFPWEVARKAKRYGRVVLAGGLNNGNVSEAVRSVKPYAVDVSSGVEEKPGIKDPRLLKEFLERVKAST